MYYLMFMFLLGLVLGLAAVASNPSPFFAALGLVMVAGMGCGLLVGYGGSFLSLILFLIYLGGMLVVFAYSAALAAEPYPETLMSWPVFSVIVFYFISSLVGGVLFMDGWELGVVSDVDGLIRGDIAGVAVVYSIGGGMLVVSA